ncbi:tumor necrosis factor receptor superfamily member wengen [Ceratina calcarata]|uniref:Tumor necrosis factor receptor superfamily member wengen n=1 Tax=Ceratina calcarata TaxID=156304 RepID=A0AAJ7NF09_9HYME|nr:tumor necrosis factor receptor superfamily member wengen [Ceratina calcarata]
MRGFSTWYTLLLPLFLHQIHSLTTPRHSLCEPGIEFWSQKHSSCYPCTKCQPEFTLSPCTVYKDAICGPLSALELDWSFLSTGKRVETGERTMEAVTSKMLWRFPEFLDRNDDRLQSDKQIGVIREKLIWDWQTVALILAVCACILFFLVAGCSALLYARQWRRMKKNFEPVGLEEISARLNLMVKAELAELVSGTASTPDDPETRCQYLEKFLDGSRDSSLTIDWPEVTGNVYIEDGKPRRTKKLQIARIQKEHRNDFN